LIELNFKQLKYNLVLVPVWVWQPGFFISIKGGMIMNSNKTTSHTSHNGDIKWEPNRDTWVAFISYGLVVLALYTAFQIFTIERVAANFITFGPITLACLGITVPILYTVFVRHRPLCDLGLTGKQLVSSLFLGLLLGWDTYTNTLAPMNVTWAQTHIPLIVMALAVGLFEAIFFRGWLQLRFEAAFGLVPGLILAALCYSFYHIGYGMTGGEILFLFGLGLTFGAFFRLTKNIFILWPFYTPIGSIYTNLKEGLTLPFEATYGFVLTIGLMIGIIIWTFLYHNKQWSR
jgi:membrane protease YdiL (CAAX protease family)